MSEVQPIDLINSGKSLQSGSTLYPLMIEVYPGAYSQMNFVINYPDGYVSEYTERTNAPMVLVQIKVEPENKLYLETVESNMFRNPYLTVEEKRRLKGIGRAVLCHSCYYMVQKYHLHPETTIHLSAFGSAFRRGAPICRWSGVDPYQWLVENNIIYVEDVIHISGNVHVNVSKQRINEQILEFLSEHYPVTEERLSSYFDLSNETVHSIHEKLQEVICDIVNNYKLIEYYQRYGFEVLDDTDGRMVEMSTTLETLLQDCKREPVIE